MDFENQKIDKDILKILKDNNMVSMTPIQAKTIPLIINGHDILGISQTGTGKTLSFLVPIINNLLTVNKPFYCLIVTPTRELALQIEKNVKLFKSLDVRSTVLIGGEKIEDQILSLKDHPHIVIGTPGRIFKIGSQLQTNRFRVLVLDEADKFFEDDFVKETEYIFTNIRKKRQTLFFTATSTENLQKKATKLLKNYKEVNLYSDCKVEKLEEFYFFVSRKYKECFLTSFLLSNKESKVILFVNRRLSTVVLSKLMKSMNIENEALNGDQDQITRNEIVNGFIKSTYNVLITTDVGSRGLDICDVDYVINYDIPQTGKDYVHRVGRTARAGRIGRAITIITQYDVPQYQILETHIGRKLNLFEFTDDYKKYEDILYQNMIEIKDKLKFDKEDVIEKKVKKHKK